jgi:hypothetical protein
LYGDYHSGRRQLLGSYAGDVFGFDLDYDIIRDDTEEEGAWDQLDDVWKTLINRLRVKILT